MGMIISALCLFTVLVICWFLLPGGTVAEEGKSASSESFAAESKAYAGKTHSA